MCEQAGPGLVCTAGTVGHCLQPSLQVSECVLTEGRCVGVDVFVLYMYMYVHAGGGGACVFVCACVCMCVCGGVWLGVGVGGGVCGHQPASCLYSCLKW